jgi:hypothetical protein
MSDTLARSLEATHRTLATRLLALYNPDRPWSGTQATADEANLTYGTARTVQSLHAAHRLGFGGIRPMLERGTAALADTRRAVVAGSSGNAG